VLLSAKATLDDRISGLEEGVDDYLPKPFHASYLVARIRSILERRREMQQRLLAELSAANEAEPIEDESVSPEIRFLHQATAVIERHLDDCDWTIEAFASEMCLSHTALFQKLKMAVGISPLEFVREIRLKKACQLICEGDHNIASISYMVGFSDPKYFTRVFKKRFGIPPSQYGERLGDAELAEEAE
jgi:AraC-like DNA-binding protein